MNKVFKVMVPAVLIFTAGAAPSEEAYACFGNSAIAPFELLNAKEVLLGKTVTLHFYSQESIRAGSLNYKFDSDSLTRTFKENSVVEVEGKEKVENAITFEGNGWCRQAVLEGKKKCYGVAVAPQSIRDAPPFVEVELLPDGDFCHLYILGKIEGIRIPEGGVPAPSSAPRRGARRGG